MNLVAISLAVVFAGYMIITDKKVGTSYSISDSWYSWKSVGKSYMFIVFLGSITFGLWYLSSWDGWRNHAAPLLIILGGFFAWCIGVAANFKQGWRESVYHNLFSVACFASVLFGFFLQGITFPLWGFLLTAGPLSLIKIDKRTTVVEAIGIGLSIAAIFYL